LLKIALVSGILLILVVPVVPTLDPHSTAVSAPHPTEATAREYSFPAAHARASSRTPYVADTLVLANGTIVPGNFLAADELGPAAIAYDSGKGEAFVADAGSNNVSVINYTTDRVIALIPVSANPKSVVYDEGNGEVFVDNRSVVNVISDITNSVVATVRSGGNDCGEMAYDPAKGEVFVADEVANKVAVINDTSDHVIARVPVGSYPQGVAYDSDDSEVFVANENSRNLSVINDTTDSVVGTVQVGGIPLELAYDSGKGEVIVLYDWGTPDVAVVSASTDKVVANITVGFAADGSYPSGIAYDGGVGKVFIAYSEVNAVYTTNDLSVVNDSTDKVVANLSVGFSPGGVAYDRGKGQVLVAVSGSDYVSVVGALSDNIVANITLGSNPWGVTYDGGRGELFATNGMSGLYVVSDSSNSASENLSIGAYPEGDAYDEGKGEIFVANFEPSQSGLCTVSVVNDSTTNLVATVSVGNNPIAAAYDGGKGEVYVATFSTNNVSVISDLTDKVVATIPVGTTPSAVAYDSGKGEIFIANSNCSPSCGQGSVSVINDTTNTVVATVPVDDDPAGVAYDSAKGEIFVANTGSNNVSVISDATNSVVSTVGVGTSPIGLAYDGGNGDVLVADLGLPSGPGEVSVISDTTNTVIATVPVGAYPIEVAYDSGNGDIYVANNNQGTISIISFGVPGSGPVITSFTSSPNPTDVTIPATLTVSASGGAPPYTLAYIGLPAGCSSSNTSSLECTSKKPGTFTVRVFVNDSAGQSVNATLSLTVHQRTAISSFTANPSEVMAGGSTNLSVSATKGIPPYTYMYAGLPTGCLSSNSANVSCTPTRLGNWMVQVYVNDSVGYSVNATRDLMVVSPPWGIYGLTATPSVEVLSVGKSTNFTAFATCADSGPPGTWPCSSSVTFRWALANNSMGTLNSTMGNPIAFTAGNTPGTVLLYMSGTLNLQTWCSGPITITISSTPTPTLTSVAVTPKTDTVAEDGTTSQITATPTCSSTCLAGTTYSWTLTNSSMGELSSSFDPTVTFFSGDAPGEVKLFLNATLNGITVHASPVSITISPTPPPTMTSLVIVPSNAVLGTGGTEVFTGIPVCQGTCPAGTTYNWTLTNSSMGTLNSSFGNPVSFTAGGRAGTVTLFVNASLNCGYLGCAPGQWCGATNCGSNQSTFVTIPISVLTSVAISPTSATVVVRGTTSPFVAIPTCSFGICPNGMEYRWTLSDLSMGSLNTTTGNLVTFTAGNTSGTVRLFVNALLNGISVQSSVAEITIPKVMCSNRATVDPTSVSLGPAGTQTFTVSAFISCGTSAAYSWTLTNNAMGKLNATTGTVVAFTAGNTGGMVSLYVNATYNGTTIQSAPVTITITSPSTGFLGLPGFQGYYVLGIGAVAGVIVVAVWVRALLPLPKKNLPSSQNVSPPKTGTNAS
jgi:YVTN family beta-propeller protein